MARPVDLAGAATAARDQVSARWRKCAICWRFTTPFGQTLFGPQPVMMPASSNLVDAVLVGRAVVIGEVSHVAAGSSTRDPGMWHLAAGHRVLRAELRGCAAGRDPRLEEAIDVVLVRSPIVVGEVVTRRRRQFEARERGTWPSGRASPVLGAELRGCAAGRDALLPQPDDVVLERGPGDVGERMAGAPAQRQEAVVVVMFVSALAIAKQAARRRHAMLRRRDVVDVLAGVRDEECSKARRIECPGCSAVRTCSRSPGRLFRCAPATCTGRRRCCSSHRRRPVVGSPSWPVADDGVAGPCPVAAREYSWMWFGPAFVFSAARMCPTLVAVSFMLM